jgi:hypothetical protein
LDVIAAWGFLPENEAYALEYYSEYAESLEDGQIGVGQIIESARISCFCRDVNNLLMWSHYANGLRGFCIEFDCDALLHGKGDRASIIDVVYQDAPPIFDASVYAVAEDQVAYHEDALHDPSSKPYFDDYVCAINEAQQLIRKLYCSMLATKPTAWKYEDESRLIFHSSASQDIHASFKYSDHAVKAIIFGEKMPQSDRDSIMNILKESRLAIPVKTASRRSGSYDLIIE